MFEREIRTADLQLIIKNLKDRVEAFESGEKYLRMKEEFHKCRAADARKIRRLEKELAEARGEIIHVRNLWFEICDELEKKIVILDKKEREWYEKFLEKISRYHFSEYNCQQYVLEVLISADKMAKDDGVSLAF